MRTRSPRLGRSNGPRIVATLCLMAAGIARPAAALDGRYEYRVSWNGIPAGSATVDVARDEHGGEALYHVDAVVRTSWLVDLLWRLRARAASSFTAGDLTPLGFQYDREENSEHSVTDVVFDASAPQAIGTCRRRGRSTVVDVHEPDVLDPITAIFRALSQPVHVGDALRYEVFTGEARYRVELTVDGEEPITVTAGTFKAWRLEPRVWKIGTGPERRLRHATVWVSQAPVRALLRIRSEVFIGAVNCDLLRLDPPASDSSS